ncbi:hypothetical protein SHIRM173S_10506 [Streptomyces hirsutus]
MRTHALGGPDDDALTRAVAALALLGERIAAVESAITRATRAGSWPVRRPGARKETCDRTGRPGVAGRPSGQGWPGGRGRPRSPEGVAVTVPGTGRHPKDLRLR